MWALGDGGMKLLLPRHKYTERSTIGDLIVQPEHWLAYTLEDRVRPIGALKIYGKTAIPEGTYQVIIDWSQRHQKQMPHIINVPGFEGIRFDIANKAEEIEGCIAVGLTRMIDWVGQSAIAWNRLFNLLSATLNSKEEVWLEITNEKEVI